MKFTKISSGLFLSLSLLLLPQCDLGTKKEEKATPAEAAMPAKPKKVVSADQILLTAKGKNADLQYTIDEYETYKNQMVQAQPQLAQLMNMPGMEKQLIWEQVVTTLMADLFVRDNGIDKTQAYQDDIDQIIKLGKQQLAVKHYVDKLKADGKLEVSGGEVKQYYENNKERFVQSRGGVDAVGVQFENEDNAKAFLDKVKDVSVDFAAEAKKDDKETRDFAGVTKMSFDIADTPLRQAIIKMNTFPSVIMVKGDDKSFWVIKGTGKTEAEYVSFDEIKDNLKAWLEQQKLPEIVADEVKELKKLYNVKENVEYFDKKAPQQQQEAEQEEPAAKEEQQQGQLKGA